MAGDRMRALIRDTEIYAETSWSPFIQNHLAWSHTARPDGDGYALCEDCPVSDPEPADFDITETEVPDTSAPADLDGTSAVPTVVRRIATFNRAKYDARKAEESADDTEPAPAPEMPAEGTEGAQADESAPDTIIIDGVTYTRSVTE